MAEDYKSAWGKYLDFSKKAGTMTFIDLLKSSGLCSPFEEGCVKEICEGAEKALENLDVC